tara:strand:+ start:17 stop:1150 length:1134 start_codon:yes stop_codon:yes gene_type:complete
VSSLFLLYCLLAFIIHLLVRHFFKKRNFVDIPDGIKKKHENEIPISGGLSFGICFALFFSCSFLLIFYDLALFFNIELPEAGFGSLGSFPYVAFFWLLLLSLLLLAICLIDDLIDLPVWIRLFAQISCTILMIQFGDMNLLNLGAVFGEKDVILPDYLGFVFTIFCVVGITNAFNWIDGIDGFFSFQVILALIGLSAMGIAGFTLAHFSMLAAFLPYSLMNIGLIGNKFKVFIGDHGAMMIGFYLACSFILLTQDPINANESVANPVNALWCVGLVVLNALRVIWKRLIKKISIFNSDREHIHHYFLDLGYSSKATLFIVCSISLIISAFGAIIFFLGLPEWFSLMAFVSILFFWAFLSRYASSIIKSARESLQSSK